MKRMKLWLGALLVCLALAVLLPVEASAAEVVASGECGENLTWVLTDDGTLTISGSGEMTNWTYSSYAPWYSYRSSITAVVIGDSVTSIGSSAFFHCTSLTGVVIPVDGGFSAYSGV